MDGGERGEAVAYVRTLLGSLDEVETETLVSALIGISMALALKIGHSPQTVLAYMHGQAPAQSEWETLREAYDEGSE